MLKTARFCSMTTILLASLSLMSCAHGTRLATQDAKETEVSDTYTVIFHGCNYLNDLETIVFLDREGDSYTFEPYSPDFNYRVIKGLGAAVALEGAKQFAGCNTSFRTTQLSRVIGPAGEVIGYEVRPIYYPYNYGLDDVLNVNYMLRDKKVVIMIRVDPSIEMMLRDGDSRGAGKD